MRAAGETKSLDHVEAAAEKEDKDGMRLAHVQVLEHRLATWLAASRSRRCHACADGWHFEQQ